MYAIIETGGKQYRVTDGDVITIEKIDAEVGAIVEFDKVMALGETFGTPYIEGATVSAKVVEVGKGPKVVIYKYKAKKDYRKKNGHRQPFTKVEIMQVGAKKASKPAAPKAEAPVEEAPKAEAAAPTKSLKSMKKAELIEFAKANNIDIDEKATNAVMIETIEAAMK